MDVAKWRSKLDLVVTLSMLGLIVWIGFRMAGLRHTEPVPRTAQARIQLPTKPVSLDGAHLRGRSDAPVGVIMYVDYSCSACRRFEQDAMPELIRDYVNTGQVLLAVRPFPLGNRGEAAMEEVGLAECAARSGKFWEAHNAVFRSKKADDKVALVAAATDISASALRTCLSADRPRLQIAIDAAKTLGVIGTPTFLVGRFSSSRELIVREARTGISQSEGWFKELLQPHLLAGGR